MKMCTFQANNATTNAAPIQTACGTPDYCPDVPEPGPPHQHQWPPSREGGGKAAKVDRREAALMKFRQKRKERCFDKKIRYVNRKKLADRRPRLKGQFVRKTNGVCVDLIGLPGSDDEDEEEDYDEDDRF
ncbi:CCT motif -containing response regulator protein [Striga asiatica]|uniref:CCT motif-containing response regulator protein n=1 Tax=Striga asiatica TaxID=4170 RepID=A0A5A7QAL6_STRAF|nr:CCT motif -containing response regulator protein [Striga asiatica]